MASPTKAPKARARPKRRKAVTKDQNLHIRVSEHQKELFNEAAEKAGGTLSTWAVMVLLAEARRVTGRE